MILSLLAAYMIMSYIMSCSGRDDRDDLRTRNGDPDDIVTLGQEQFWRETWFYFAVINDSVGVAYEFRKSSGCGVIEDVYLFDQYFVGTSPSDSTASKFILPKTTRRNPLAPY